MIMRSDAMASLVAATMLWTAAAASPTAPVCDVQRTAPEQGVAAPGKAMGQVVKVDTAAGKVTIRQPDGKSHEYLASRSTLRDLKEGDRLEVKLKQPGTC
jgi:Cu/Ag efflux protein CusF